MRAIDADTLKKTLRDWIRDHWTEAFTGDDAGSEFADMIDHAETIDAVPVVHAHLIEDEFGFQSCCKCGYAWDGLEYATPYCPNCGAKMIEPQESEKTE